MNKSKFRNPVPGFLLVSFLLAAPMLLVGAETQTAGQKEPVQPSSTQKTAEQDQDQSGEAESAVSPPQPAQARPVKEFQPTDKIGADSAVAFPIDI